jgi:hypothetical protein
MQHNLHVLVSGLTLGGCTDNTTEHGLRGYLDWQHKWEQEYADSHFRIVTAGFLQPSYVT